MCCVAACSVLKELNTCNNIFVTNLLTFLAASNDTEAGLMMPIIWQCPTQQQVVVGNVWLHTGVQSSRIMGTAHDAYCFVQHNMTNKLHLYCVVDACCMESAWVL